jgi:hypothetical protein
MSKISLDGLPDKQRKEIEAILNIGKHKIVVNDVDADIQHQIDKVLDTPMTMKPDEAIRVVRNYLNDRKRKNQ